MDLQKLAQLAKTNPSAAKAFLKKNPVQTAGVKVNKAPSVLKKKEPERTLKLNDRVFTEKQLDTIVKSLVEKEVAKIPKPKDGKNPTKEEIKAIIAPLIPVITQPKDGKDGKVTQKHIDEITNKILKEVAVNPDVTDAIVRVFKDGQIKSEDIPGFSELKARVEKLADNQKWINRPMGGGYTDADVRRVIAENGGSGISDGDKGDVTVASSGAAWTVTGIQDEPVQDANSSDGDILVYRTASNSWVRESKPAGGSNPALNDVTDVTITTVGDNEVLAYDTGTSKWINQTAAEAGLAAASHTHTASEVTDFDTEVSNNTDVAANTAARHAAVTVTDSAEIDFTLTGQNITASLVAGSIDETKLDASVNASLDLADSSVQPGDALTTLSGDLPFSQIEQIATNRILGRSTAGTGDIEVLADADARNIMGLGTSDSPQFAGINVGHATDTTITRVSAGVIAVEGVDVSLTGHTHAISDVTGLQTALDGKITAFADPNADRIVFWDDSAGAFVALTASTGLTISGTSMTVRSASETQTGISERATDAETVTGTDTTRYISPANLTARLAAPGTIGNTTPATSIAYTKAVATVSAVGNTGTSQTVNANTARLFTFTLNGNCAFTFSNLTTGVPITLHIYGDGTGGYTPTFPTAITLYNNATIAYPTQTTDLLALTVVNDGANVVISAAGNYAAFS